MREEIEALTNLVGTLQQEVKFLWRIVLRQQEAFAKELLDAVRRGEITAVRQFIRHGAEPTWRDEEGGTALHISVFYNRMDVTNLLLSEGWPVDDRDHKRRTPLHLAAGAGRLEMMEVLLRWKARVDLPDENGHTALHLAALGGHLECARLLLAASALQVASEDEEGRSPLHLAARHGNSGLVELLLKSGANPNHRSHNKHTPLHEAAKWGDDLAVETLLEAGANPCLTDGFHRLPGDYAGLKPPVNDAARERQDRIKDMLRKAEAKA